MSNAWSDTLVQQTRAVLNLDFAPCGDLVHMKNITGRYGQISLNDLVSKQFVIQDKQTNAKHRYASADELISAGWAID